jgi:hypothetical protein
MSAPGTQWAIKVVGSVSAGSTAAEFLSKVPTKAIKDITVWKDFKSWSALGVSPSVKVLCFEIMDRNTGETATLAYVGGSLGAGFGRAGAGLTWATFETNQPYQLSDFAGGARVWNASAGLGIGYGASGITFGIIFPRIDVKQASIEGAIALGNSVWIGGPAAGTGYDVSETVGKAVIVGVRPYAGGDGVDQLIPPDAGAQQADPADGATVDGSGGHPDAGAQQDDPRAPDGGTADGPTVSDGGKNEPEPGELNFTPVGSTGPEVTDFGAGEDPVNWTPATDGQATFTDFVAADGTMLIFTPADIPNYCVADIQLPMDYAVHDVAQQDAPIDSAHPVADFAQPAASFDHVPDMGVVHHDTFFDYHDPAGQGVLAPNGDDMLPVFYDPSSN